jgi:glutamate dehydrogenase (NAD(P)+)
LIRHDEFGPEMVITVYDPATGMRGFTVIDNTKLGPGKGGIRLTPTVTVEEVMRLARAMTWKNALAGLPFGGAKSGIVADPGKITIEKKEELVRAFSRSIKSVCPGKYIAGPDMNTTQREMQWFAEENGDMKSATGKPKALGGLPHELGSTGFGVVHSAAVAAEHLGMDIAGAAVAIEGFGNVGWFAGKLLSERGARIVAISDSSGAVHNPDGMDFEKLSEVKKKAGSVSKYRPGTPGTCDSILSADADILITAAIPDLVKPRDVARLKFRLIVEGSNIPMSPETEKSCHGKGILVIPDFVANAGGAISSYVEYKGGTEKEMFALVEKKIKENTRIMLREMKASGGTPREAALMLAMQKVREAKEIIPAHSCDLPQFKKQGGGMR